MSKRSKSKRNARIRNTETLEKKWRGVKSKDPISKMKSNGERLKGPAKSGGAVNPR